MVSMNKQGYRPEVMRTWIIIDYPFLHRKLIHRLCILHTSYKIAMAVSIILEKNQTSAKMYLIANPT